ncbi:hypothetical protein Ancab_013913 [Ancistrocladus abbreviatus]
MGGVEELNEKLATVNLEFNKPEEEEAKAILENQIENAWKDINEELIILGQNSSLPKPVIISIVNTAKATDIFNRNCRDAFSNPNHLTQGIISSLVVDPIST